jgi:16S rRNA (cytosine967-C5)-methyltransferase
MHIGRHIEVSPRWYALQTIKRVEQDNAYADLVLSGYLKKIAVEKDKALLSELARGTIRWKKKLDWILSRFFQDPAHKMPEEVRWIVWLGLYQLVYMRVPQFASVHETVELVKACHHGKWSGVVNGILRSYLRNPEKGEYPQHKKNDPAALAIQYSFPEWLIERWLRQFGFEQTLALCEANNRRPVLAVRRNPLLSSVPQFEEKLALLNIVFEKSAVSDFYFVKNMTAVSQNILLHDGWMTIQDPSAGLPVLLADPRPGQTILDVCAAPGGKTTHLAELSGNRALIIAGDKNYNRIRLLKNAVSRLKLSVYTLVAEAQNFPVQNADVVLLDAPCSGLGALRRKPDIRWQRTLSEIHACAKLQSILLYHTAGLVKQGGALIYSTCTIDRAENEDVIHAFCAMHPEFEIEAPHPDKVPRDFITENHMIRTWPHRQDMDGSFCVKMKKKGRA